MRGLAGAASLAVFLGIAAPSPASEPGLSDRFAVAIERGDLAAVKALVEEGNAPDSAIDYGGEPVTPLYKAAGEGRTEIVRYLIEKGADVNFRGKEWGHTPLSEAAGRGFDDVVEVLLKAGADPKIKDRNGYTPLLVAAATSGGDAEKVQALVDAGASLDAKDNRGFNALDLALKRTDMRAGDVVKLLESKGLKPTPEKAAP